MEMQNPIWFIGACALVAAVAFFAGASQPQYPSVEVVEAATTGSATPSTEMIIKNVTPLPVEQWDAY
jgi:hypothetical protein